MTRVPFLMSCTPALLALACAQVYEQPSPSNPHALVQLRLVYHVRPGTQLDESVKLNDQDILFPPDARDSRGACSTRACGVGVLFTFLSHVHEIDDAVLRQLWRQRRVLALCTGPNDEHGSGWPMPRFDGLAAQSE